MDENNVMDGQELEQVEAVAGKKPRKPRRKMTPEEKEEAARKRAERKAQAENMQPDIYVQFEESEAVIKDLQEAAIADFRKEKKRTQIISFKLYVKPEERAAYYVINDAYSGKVEY